MSHDAVWNPITVEEKLEDPVKEILMGFKDLDDVAWEKVKAHVTVEDAVRQTSSKLEQRIKAFEAAVAFFGGGSEPTMKEWELIREATPTRRGSAPTASIPIPIITGEPVTSSKRTRLSFQTRVAMLPEGEIFAKELAELWGLTGTACSQFLKKATEKGLCRLVREEVWGGEGMPTRKVYAKV